MSTPDLSADQKKQVLAQWHEAYWSYMKQESRLSLPYFSRLPLGMGLAFLVGLGIGMSNGSSVVGLQYRAENAHRLPNTTTGWYLYHKTKNYEMVWGGLRKGVRTGATLGFWTAAFLSVENSIDQCRGTKDFFNTTFAGVSLAGVFSFWHRFPFIAAARTAKQGLVVGLLYGLSQDAVGYMRGRTPRYMDFVLRFRRR